MRLIRRVKFFLQIAWRPAYPPDDATWWEIHYTYALPIKTAWEVACILNN